MTYDPSNPLGMIPDPFSGDSFNLPETLCSDQRRLWFRRSNEIISFLMTTELALKDCKSKYEHFASEKKLNPDTPFRLQSSDGRILDMPIHALLKQCSNGIDILCRQVFVMLYGSLETFLFELIERSYNEIGKTEGILELSLEIMMRRNWDGKFCKMSDVFDLNYKANEMISHFKGFEMNFGNKVFKNPLLFLDELAQVRHKIIHASSILAKGRLIFLNAQVFHVYYAYCALLTDYVDHLFAKRFGYDRVKINPAKA